MHNQEIDFGQKFDNKFTGRPPHMSTEDWPIWYRYLAKYPNLYDYYYFDVCFPSSCECPDSQPPNMKKMWNRITGKRIDALCHSDKGWTIVEARCHADSGSIGAILMYHELWKIHSGTIEPHNLVIPTDNPDPDLLIVAPLYNVEIVIV